MGWPSINGFRDGENVESQVLNRPVQQLAERTEFLRGKLDGIGTGTVFVVGALARDNPEDPASDYPDVGDVVYRTESGAYARAIANPRHDDMFYAAPEAMAVGVVSQVDGDRATIILHGHIELHVSLASRVEDGGDLRSGRYYLSARERGKLTPNPNGPVIYVGDYRASSPGSVSILVNPQYRDTGESHVHRAFRLTGRPKGRVTASSGDGQISINGSITSDPYYDARGWYVSDGTLELDLAEYPEVLNYILPLPYNSAALTIDGVDAKSRSSGLFETDGDWSIVGTKLIWHNINTSGILPFGISGTSVTPHDIVLYISKMTVGPTGFVTSLTPMPGSPIRIVSHATSAAAVQGDLDIGLDINFTTKDADAPGWNVVKSIDGSTFKTGPVVERIVAGGGISVVSRRGPSGSGEVEISLGSSIYSGDFETIALENAKQALVAGMFPYTRLLGWNTSGTNVKTAFTAKFRVPDSLDATNRYKVVVSASVFGEESSDTNAAAGIELTSSALPDFTVPSYGSDNTSSSFRSGTVAGATTTINIPFSEGYTGFDPVQLHGFSDQNQPQQRIYDPAMLLKKSDGTPLIVAPGWFVGIRIARTGTTANAAYTGPVGFISLRWNLIPVEA